MSKLISDAYLAEQRKLHADPRGYGAKGRKWAYFAENLAKAYGCKSVLDYGCGQGSLLVSLTGAAPWLDVQGYDPAVAAFPGPAMPADLVTCTDVLEHVEPESVDAVIAELRRLTQKVLFVVVGTAATSKTLSDGRQAHISLHDKVWWGQHLARHFVQVEEQAISPHKQWVAVFTPRSKEP